MWACASFDRVCLCAAVFLTCSRTAAFTLTLIVGLSDLTNMLENNNNNPLSVELFYLRD